MNVLSWPSIVFHSLGAAFLWVALPIASFFGYAPLPSPIVIETVVLAPASEPPAMVATSTPTPAVVVALKPVTPAPKPKPAATPVPLPIPIPVPTSSEPMVVGVTTLAVQSVPLLSGGEAHAGESVPVAYLQITNIGKEGALLKGFWVTQNGSAEDGAVIGLSTVDDKGGSRGITGGTEGATPFVNGAAFAPTDAFFKAGQMRLFTIKAIVSRSALYAGTQLMIDVTSVDSSASMRAQFPIRGTTWSIVP